jgi:hypothetical protein
LLLAAQRLLLLLALGGLALESLLAALFVSGHGRASLFLPSRG